MHFTRGCGHNSFLCCCCCRCSSPVLWSLSCSLCAFFPTLCACVCVCVCVCVPCSCGLHVRVYVRVCLPIPAPPPPPLSLSLSTIISNGLSLIGKFGFNIDYFCCSNSLKSKHAYSTLFSNFNFIINFTSLLHALNKLSECIIYISIIHTLVEIAVLTHSNTEKIMEEKKGSNILSAWCAKFYFSLLFCDFPNVSRDVVTSARHSDTPIGSVRGDESLRQVLTLDGVPNVRGVCVCTVLLKIAKARTNRWQADEQTVLFTCLSSIYPSVCAFSVCF